MVFVLSAFYPFENKNRIISFFFYGGNQLNGKYKGNLSKFTTTASLALLLRVLNEQCTKKLSLGKKGIVSFISPKPDDKKSILRTNFQSATKFVCTVVDSR